MAKTRYLADELFGSMRAFDRDRTMFDALKGQQGMLDAVAGRHGMLNSITGQLRVSDSLGLANQLGKFDMQGLAAVGLADHACHLHKTFADSLALGDQYRLAGSAASFSEMLDRSKAMGDMHALHKSLFASDAMLSIKSVHESMARIGAASELLGGYAAMARLHDGIEKHVGLDHAKLWGNHLAGIAAPSMSLLATGMFDRPTGLLSAFDGAKGTLTWLRQLDESESALVSAAALMTAEVAEPAPRRITVRTDVRCNICDDPMLVRGESFHWVSEEEVVINLGVVPICPACTRRAPGRTHPTGASNWRTSPRLGLRLSTAAVRVMANPPGVASYAPWSAFRGTSRTTSNAVNSDDLRTPTPSR